MPRFGIPLLLGILLALASAVLAVVELAQPPIKQGFNGIALSNSGKSRGARAGLGVFRNHLDWLPYPGSGLVLSPDRYIHGLRFAIVAMALVQALALLTVVRLKPVSPWPWLVGPALSSIILLAYPTISTDVFSYASFGWEANHGANPYLAPPASIAGDPFARMNDWAHITTPYGPVWTQLSRVIVRLSGDQPFATALVFKFIAGAASVCLGWIVYRLARQLTDDPGLAAGALVLASWSPVLLAESPGTAHNDAAMMALALAGLLLTLQPWRGAIRTGLLLILGAVLIKPIVAPLLLLACLIRLAGRSDGITALVRRWALDFVALAAAATLAFASFWDGRSFVSTLWENQRKLYFDKPLEVNPIWVWAVPNAVGRLGGDHAQQVVRTHVTAISRGFVFAFLALAGYVTICWVRRNRQAGSSSSLLRMQAAAWASVAAGLGLAPINAHPWYAIWAIGPLALVWTMRTGIPRHVWALVFLAWMLMSFLVYHTWPAIAPP